MKGRNYCTYGRSGEQNYKKSTKQILVDFFTYKNWHVIYDKYIERYIFYKYSNLKYLPSYCELILQCDDDSWLRYNLYLIGIIKIHR